MLRKVNKPETLTNDKGQRTNDEPRPYGLFAPTYLEILRPFPNQTGLLHKYIHRKHCLLRQTEIYQGFRELLLLYFSKKWLSKSP